MIAEEEVVSKVSNVTEDEIRASERSQSWAKVRVVGMHV
jgi:hypothetical protein